MNFVDNIRATLLYFDLFDHPLLREELYTFFPERMDATEFNRMLFRMDSFGTRQHIPWTDGLFYIRDNSKVVAIRKHREKKAKRMLQATRIIGRLLRYFPFVRAAFLSGSLSKGVNGGDADIDLFIIAAEQRIWICRSFLTVFKRIFLLNNKKFLCPNYFVSEHHLEIPEKNIFTATELITLRPLFNGKKLQDLLEANRWALEFYPNFKIDRIESKISWSPLQRLLELPMSDGYTADWDARLMHYFEGLWEKRYPEYTPSEREFLFRTTPYSSKVHPNDFQTRILDAYERRLKEENLERLTRIDG
jgi:hypothetical protein